MSSAGWTNHFVCLKYLVETILQTCNNIPTRVQDSYPQERDKLISKAIEHCQLNFQTIVALVFLSHLDIVNPTFRFCCYPGERGGYYYVVEESNTPPSSVSSATSEEATLETLRYKQSRDSETPEPGPHLLNCHVARVIILFPVTWHVSAAHVSQATCLNADGDHQAWCWTQRWGPGVTSDSSLSRPGQLTLFGPCVAIYCHLYFFLT